MEKRLHANLQGPPRGASCSRPSASPSALSMSSTPFPPLPCSSWRRCSTACLTAESSKLSVHFRTLALSLDSPLHTLLAFLPSFADGVCVAPSATDGPTGLFWLELARICIQCCERNIIIIIISGDVKRTLERAKLTKNKEPI